MIGDGTQLLELVERIAEAAERIADHLTKQPMKAVSGEKPKRNYNEPQPEQSHGQGLRPKQASRS